MKGYAIADLLASGADSGRPYHEFVREESMSVGVYVLPAGAVDRQQPHTEDEVYVVLSGTASFTAGDETRPVQRGDTLFVAAGVAHRFHDITDALRLIVVFAPPEGRVAEAGRSAVRSVGFIGVRTAAFTAMAALYRDVLGLEPVLARADAAWFRAADGSAIHVYADADEDHAFFGSGPVVGLVVDDFAARRAALVEAGIEFIGEPQREGGTAGNHFRGPDGNVYEIIGPDRGAA